jgi:hypothetical protein
MQQARRAVASFLHYIKVSDASSFRPNSHYFRRENKKTLAMAFVLLSMQTLYYVLGSIILCLMYTLIFILWISPLKMKLKLERNGFSGPRPQFPFGNLFQMMRKKHATPAHPSSGITHDIHASVFPYFARWRKSFGNF